MNRPEGRKSHVPCVEACRQVLLNAGLGLNSRRECTMILRAENSPSPGGEEQTINALQSLG
jgi:hypothetical protein